MKFLRRKYTNLGLLKDAGSGPHSFIILFFVSYALISQNNKSLEQLMKIQTINYEHFEEVGRVFLVCKCALENLAKTNVINRIHRKVRCGF